eukprot:84724_1
MATAVTMAGIGVGDDNEDSDLEGHNVKGVNQHQSGDGFGASPVMQGLNVSTNTNGRTTATTTTVPATSSSNTTKPTTSFSIRSCGKGFCSALGCCFGTIFDFLDMLWTNYNPICISVFFVIGLGFTLGMVIFFSDRYDTRLTSPSQFHYTTCIIKEIHQRKDDDDDWWNDITFLYSTDNSDWNKEGIYKIKREDWKKENAEGDIGTCVYSIDPHWGNKFTIQNYLIHSDTSAMWLILDNKMGLISWIIFFVFSLFFCIMACLAWLIKKCEFVEFTMAGVGGFGLFVVACMCVGWPVMVMGSIVMAGLDGPLGDGIVVNDVYDVTDCIIGSVDMNMTFIPENENRIPFVMVKYKLNNEFRFSHEGDEFAVATYSNTTDPIFYGVGDIVSSCYKNRFSQQIVLNDAPDVEWLQLPMNRGTGIVVIVVGVLLICAPCTIACLGACNN